MSAQLFRKRPVTIEAIKWDGTDSTANEIRKWAESSVYNNLGTSIVDTAHIQHLWDYDGGCYILPSGKTIHAPYKERCLIVLTLEGEMVARPGWWIIKGVKGEFYPCEGEIFDGTYEPVVSLGGQK